ncbi:MAG TPA: enoyl-CoA hydratase/isomerase family protein, partial [Acidimicrobiales bacterium]|nr:enoyl-CoA hydratase/isomerase family protein [Acidimicrobiales bacterium]
MSGPELTTLHLAADGPIGRLTLDRPEKLNPLGTTTLLELVEAARWFDAQRAVKVVVVTGRGRSFSAGADLATFGDRSANAGLSPREAADAGRLMAEAVERMRAVTVVGLHGHCIGGGLVLAAACDLRVAADDTYFSIPEVDLGIPLAWGGIPRLVRELGPAMTRELVMTCRPFTAAEAQALGFLNRVVPPELVLPTVEELAAALVSKSSLTLSATKAHVNAVLEAMSGAVSSWSDADGL